MANKMLIDASHQEETRVVVVRGNRIEEFDFESEHKRQIKGNIYLAKVTRVEPSLQAAFVEYGGNRHGFLAFSEIHPDYYQIPKADRQALIEEELRRAQAEDDEADEERPSRGRNRNRRPATVRASGEGTETVSEAAPSDDADAAEGAAGSEDSGEERSSEDGAQAPEPGEGSEGAATDEDEAADRDEVETIGGDGDAEPPARRDRRSRGRGRSRGGDRAESDENGAGEEAEEVDQVGAEDAMEEVPVRQVRSRRQYKIQEVIKRRQILLVQVVKEERGNKGAALTTYLSLAGRYSVLMPNTARGGGISRKITNAADRKRLKEVARDLEVPRGMGIILRTAGANRTKAEVKRDYEYLMRLWETVRSLTLSSTAPALVYEEGSLIKRSIRDLYNKDIDQILVSGEDGYREAKDFMRMLMPSQAKVVQPYRDPTPIFARQGIEAQLDKMLQPLVTLKSGGYIIINQTEALVAVDVNSGRSTREHSVEDTALQTNLEASEEVARQLRLRDLAGLVVVDFIDMEEKRNNRAVEKRLKDCLKDDRARIQLGRISHFGLLEMSRQRIRASVLESTMQTCPVCGGAGHVRSASSLALHVLRSIEEFIQKHSTHDVIVNCSTESALYILNEKRATIAELERHSGLRIHLRADDAIGHSGLRIEQGLEASKRAPLVVEHVSPLSVVTDDDALDEIAASEAPEDEAPEEVAAEEETGGEPRGENGASRRRSRRGRNRNRRREDGPASLASDEADAASEGVEADGDEQDEDGGEAIGAANDEESREADERGRRRRRRGRRGGRRGRDGEEANERPVMDVANDGFGDSEGMSGEDALDPLVASPADWEEGMSDVREWNDGSGDSLGSPEAEMVDAVEAMSDLPLEDVEADESEARRVAVVPDENEIIAANAEAGAAIDGNPPLDAVFPSGDDASSFRNDALEADAAAARDQPDSATREPRLTRGGEADEMPESAPKRTGWWARRFTS